VWLICESREDYELGLIRENMHFYTDQFYKSQLMQGVTIQIESHGGLYRFIGEVQV